MDNEDTGVAPEGFRSGFVALVGPTNAGKSTFINRLVGQKIAIVSPKPQTTRDRILGIVHRTDGQIVFVDTPGFHDPKHLFGETLLEKANKEARSADVVVLMLDSASAVKHPKPNLPKQFVNLPQKKILLLNKVDKVSKPLLLPVIEGYAQPQIFEQIFPVSALKDENFESFLSCIIQLLPEGPTLFPVDQVTDRPVSFQVTEIVREKVLRLTQEEVPHSIAVEVEQWEEIVEKNLVRIGCLIYVERESQKGILIGKEGAMLRTVGTRAREEIERLLEKKVFLQLWVKVLPDWRKKTHMLKRAGY